MVITIKTRRIRASQYEHTVNGVVYEIHEVERSEGFSQPLWNVRRQGQSNWFDSARMLREAKLWAEADAERSQS